MCLTGLYDHYKQLKEGYEWKNNGKSMYQIKIEHKKPTLRVLK